MTDIARPKILMHAGLLRFDNTAAAYDLVIPESFVDFSEHSPRGLTWTVDIQSVSGTVTTWTLNTKFQVAAMDVAGNGFSAFRWIDLQTEQVTKKISEGVAWYGGANAAPIVAIHSNTLPVTVQRTIRDFGTLCRLSFNFTNVTGASAGAGLIVSISAV